MKIWEPSLLDFLHPFDIKNNPNFQLLLFEWYFFFDFQNKVSGVFISNGSFSERIINVDILFRAKLFTFNVLTFINYRQTNKCQNRQPKYIQRFTFLPKNLSVFWQKGHVKGHVKTENLNFKTCKITLSASVAQSFSTYSMLGEESSIFK